MIKRSLAVVSMLTFSTAFVGAVEALPITINDNYVGARPTIAGFEGADIIGDADKFDVRSLQVELSGGTLNLGITTSYFDNVGQYATTFGDVFVSSNGWSPFGAAPYLDDDASNGEVWGYALVFDNHGEQLVQSGQVGSMIGANGTVSLVAVGPNAQIELSHGDGGFRGNQEVGIANAAGLSVLSLGNWSIAGGANGYSTLNLSISFGDIPALMAAEKLGFHFGFSCGNDVIEGAYQVSQNSEVPEPSTILLLLSGFTGALRRRRQSNA